MIGRAPALVAGVALLLLPLAGCGGTPVLDGRALEDSVADRLATAVGERPRVACPTGRPAAAGTRISCAVTATDGQRTVARVRVLDDGGRVAVAVAP